MRKPISKILNRIVVLLFLVVPAGIQNALHAQTDEYMFTVEFTLPNGKRRSGDCLAAQDATLQTGQIRNGAFIAQRELDRAKVKRSRSRLRAIADLFPREMLKARINRKRKRLKRFRALFLEACEASAPAANPPELSAEDADNDGIENALDNCPDDFNPAQEDIDRNDIGDSCEAEAPDDIVPIPEFCGDGIINNNEVCDCGSDLICGTADDITPETGCEGLRLGLAEGELRCAANCETFDLSLCQTSYSIPNREAYVATESNSRKSAVLVSERTSLDHRELALIVNTSDSQSVSVASAYKIARNIPEENIIRIAFSPNATNMPRETFNALYEEVKRKTPAHVQAYALTFTTPWRVDCMSITSAFAFGFDTKYCRVQSTEKCEPSQ